MASQKQALLCLLAFFIDKNKQTFKNITSQDILSVVYKWLPGAPEGSLWGLLPLSGLQGSIW